MPIPLEKTIPITQASRKLAQIIKQLPREKYFFIMKNYKPVAKISAVDEEDAYPIDALETLRARAWGSHTKEIQDAFAQLENVSERELPLLLRKL
ncbi:MAG: hypothetical protein WC659_06805 [Patescibacteria group bacterium]